MKNSTTHYQKILYQAKDFSVFEKTITVKGKSIKKQFIRRNTSVVIAALSPENELYLASQYRSAVEKQTLELIAGTLEEGEDALEGAKRELAEEAGLTAKNWKHLITLQVSSNMNARVDAFLAQNLQQGTAQQEEDEEITITKAPLKEAVEKVMKGEICNSSHVATILLLDKLQKQEKIE